MRLPFASSFAVGLALAAGASGGEPGPFISALWLVQRFGTPDAAAPRHDQHVKAVLSKALKDSTITAPEIEGLMDPATFRKLAGPDDRLDLAEVRSALEASLPASRGRLLPQVRAHADLLTTSFDMIDAVHAEAGEKLADWLVENYRPGKPLHVTLICTGNSRRSILGATMGNIAAAYCGMPEVRFHSGGTAPSAFNERTVAALRAIGVEIEPSGKDAPRGEPKTANPVYRVRWGTPDEPAMETLEFSKLYADAANPQSGFAALMVCGEADAGCPLVKGAAVRISMPYLDPKIYDGGAFESSKYAERRDDMGRLLLAAFMQAENRLHAANKSTQRE